MIRTLHGNDVEQLARLIAELHRRSVYRHAKVSMQQTLMTIASLTSSPNGFVRVAEHDAKVTGIIACTSEEFWWAEQKTGAKYATDMLFYSKRKGDGVLMLREAIDWAWSRPRVICFETAVSSGIEHAAASAMYESAGLQLQGSFWRINHPNLQAKP